MKGIVTLDDDGEAWGGAGRCRADSEMQSLLVMRMGEMNRGCHPSAHTQRRITDAAVFWVGASLEACLADSIVGSHGGVFPGRGWSVSELSKYARVQYWNVSRVLLMFTNVSPGSFSRFVTAGRRER